ncbi:MAG: bis(5'-nucleosyl)-tetraphosphatase (symmetrical) YqeK [Eubacterium sp.]|jgi:predicted HD superfamily hydrolase involved in NAD metabolism
MNTDYIYRYADEHLTDKRKKHTEGVRKSAKELALRFGADPKKADIAALCHDLFRGHSVEDINYYVNKYDLGDKYLGSANLAHSKIAAAVMKDEFGIDDEDILNAVSYHTTGRVGMSLLEKVIYLADKIEPLRDYPGVERIRKTAETDIDKACLESFAGTIRLLKSKGADIDGDTLGAYDWFSGIVKEKENSKDKAE